MVDKVGTGKKATDFETAPTLKLPNNTLSIQRLDPNIDTDDNSKDFITGEPTPQSSEEIIDDQSSASLTPINIAKTRKNGTVLSVKGVVTYSPQSRSMFMQDETSGIAVDLSGADLEKFVGKEVTVRGKISAYGGMPQIVLSGLNSIEVTDETPNKVEPKVVTINEILTSNRKYEGMLVLIEQAKLSKVGGTDPDKIFNHEISQSNTSITLRTKAFDGISEGDYVNITAVGGYFNNPQLQTNLEDIVIYASHFNEYVSGNYKSSLTNFAKLAAKYNVKAVELKTSQDLIDAMKNLNFAIMIFTEPSRRAGSSGRVDFRSYSDEELKALSDFSKEGKTVIVTGWGDYYESYSNSKELPTFTPD